MNFKLVILVLSFIGFVEVHSQTGASFNNESVTFYNADIVLAGQLYIPIGKGPFPAVIFTHGSGDAGIDNSRYRLEAEYFAKHGILSLVYDKRGFTNSSGDWRQATYEDLAKDAVAAVSLLNTRPEVDTLKIGLRGSSQSGWILPIAAKISAELDFLILISPPGVTTREQIIYDVRTDVEDLGHNPYEVENAIEVIKSAMIYSETLDNWDRHQKILDKYAGKSWLETAAGPPVANHWMWKWVSPVLDFDAVPLMREINESVLIILGENDREIPSQIAGYRFERELQERGGNYKIVYFPNADHGLRSTNNIVEGEEPPLVDGYLEIMKKWILELE